MAGSRALIEWLVNRARPYVYSTAAPAATAAAALAALDIVRAEPQRRQALLARAAALARRAPRRAGTSAVRRARSSRWSSASRPRRWQLRPSFAKRGLFVAGHPSADRARGRGLSAHQPQQPIAKR